MIENPILASMRRTRDDDNTCFGNERRDDSMLTSDSFPNDTAEQHRWKRRKTIMEALNSLSLRQRKGSPPELEMSGNHRTGDDMDDEDSTSEDDQLRSDKEEANSRIMYQLAFGKPKTTRNNVVYQKLEEMIRNSRIQATMNQTQEIQMVVETSDDRASLFDSNED